MMPIKYKLKTDSTHDSDLSSGNNIKQGSDIPAAKKLAKPKNKDKLEAVTEDDTKMEIEALSSS